ncbi:MarR family protein [Actinocrispum wychmicini]|uniref:MarR family protein n=2 Tax=Actinocrispum wychmicini TaxID=1213861 RepID=A0A4R2J698_9PSEU|nr:MarR family protein [Actinocrispum wychmicini]
MSQLDLARVLGVDPSVLVSILNELEDRDLATRRREPADRRRHVVELTEGGRAEIDQVVGGFERDLFAALDEADQAQLEDLLRKVAATHDSGDCTED